MHIDYRCVDKTRVRVGGCGSVGSVPKVSPAHGPSKAARSNNARVNANALL